MAVENKFADSDFATGTLVDASKGGTTKSVHETLAVAAADDDGSVYGLFLVNSNDVPKSIDIQCSAVTGGTDYDLGLYDYDGEGAIGSAVDADILMDGQTMASAAVDLDGMQTVAAANRGKTFWELAGETTDPQKQYIVALTANTVGTAAGTIHVDMEYYTAG